MTRRRLRIISGAFVALLLCVAAGNAAARPEVAWPYPGMQTVHTQHRFDVLVERLEQAIEKHQMSLVAMASASRGAAARGVKIAGNAVLMVFRNDFAVRMLEANVRAGIEAPLRIYVTENADGSAGMHYRAPSAVFAPYGASKLDEMARELDAIFARIVSDAAGN